jgi:hypothetical protein
LPATTTKRRNGFLQTRQPPAFWAWLAGRGQLRQKAFRLASTITTAHGSELGRTGISELTCFASSGTNVTCTLVESGHEARLIEQLGDSLFYRYHARVRELLFRLPLAGVDTTLESTPLKTFSAGP